MRGGCGICICIFMHSQFESQKGLAAIPEDGWMSWHRDSVSGSGLFPWFSRYFFKKGKSGLAGHEGVRWAVGLPSQFLCNLPSFRQIKGNF